MIGKIFIGLAIAFMVLGVGYIAVRNFVNDNKCAQTYGNGAVWAGQNKCYIERLKYERQYRTAGMYTLQSPEITQ